MTAKDAIKLYKSRDTSEKLFRGDKSYLGDKSLRIYGDSSADSKIFIEFIALIIRNRIYNYLQDEMKELAKRPNFMTVPAAIRELEKIEMVRLTDNRYRLDHAVTATQKTILKAFGMDAGTVKYYAEEISRILKEGK
jgi:transposase